MSETPSSPQTDLGTPSAPSPAPSNASSSNNKKKNSQTGKKVSAEILERRRVGRLKAAETMAKKIKKSGIERRDNNLKYTVFANINLINQKNYFTDYLKKDDQIFILHERKQLRINKAKPQGNKSDTAQAATPSLGASNNNNAGNDVDVDDDDEEDEENENNQQTVYDRKGSSTIVIHPGSRNIRIGLASDVYPKTFPFVIAVPKDGNEVETDDPYQRTLDADELDSYNKTKESLAYDFKERMKYYKRRIIPNSNEIVQNFNKKVIPTKIPEHNDVHKFEYIQPKPPITPKSYYVGQDALRLDSKYHKLRYPLLTNGKLNDTEDDYKSPQELSGDIQLIISDLLANQFQVKNLKNFHITLVIPDLYDKIYVETFIQLLLQMNFKGVAVIQESLASTYGAGVSSACVIDIGAKTTKVACVDDGMIVPNSRAVLNYGGDDITRFFYKLLKESSFPIEFDENSHTDWSLLEQLKEKFITFQDANITVQLYNFIKRYPDRLSEKYEFKVFDEVILAPLALFFPEIFIKPKNYKTSSTTRTKMVDIFNGDPNDPTSSTQKNSQTNNLYADKPDFDILKDLLNTDSLEDGVDSSLPTIAALDKVIIQSIANASRYDFTKTKSFYENLLIVGGTSKIEALDFVLTDRINIWRPKILALTQLPDFLKKIEQIVSNFEKEHEFAKIQSEEELQPLQDQLYQIIEKELDEFLELVNNPLINVEVLPAPREIDPSILTWKGASVFARLKIMEELWITERDWDLLGSRTLQHKALFNY